MSPTSAGPAGPQNKVEFRDLDQERPSATEAHGRRCSETGRSCTRGQHKSSPRRDSSAHGVPATHFPSPSPHLLASQVLALAGSTQGRNDCSGTPGWLDNGGECAAAARDDRSARARVYRRGLPSPPQCHPPISCDDLPRLTRQVQDSGQV